MGYDKKFRERVLSHVGDMRVRVYFDAAAVMNILFFYCRISRTLRWVNSTIFFLGAIKSRRIARFLRKLNIKIFYQSKNPRFFPVSQKCV